MKSNVFIAATLLVGIGFPVVDALGKTGAEISGSVITINVDAGSDYTYDETIGSDVTRVVKTGSGRLIINVDNSSFKGAVDINEGVLLITHCGALGRSDAANRLLDGPITVANKAQLYTKLIRQGQSFEQISKRLILSGNGPDGADNKSKGALVAHPSGTAAGGSYVQDAWIAHVELAGDAMINIVDSRVGIRTTDLKDHTLTIGNYYDGGYVDCSFVDSRHLSAGTIYNWGTATTWEGGYGLMFVGATTWPTEGRVGIVSDASMLKLGDLETESGFAADVKMCNTYDDKVVRIYAYGISSANYLLSGDLDISHKTILSAKAATDPLTTVVLSGKLTGSADLEVSGANVRLVAQNANNDFSGNLTVADTEMTLASIPNPSKVMLSGSSRLNLPIGEGGWSGADFAAAVPQIRVSGSAAEIVAYTGAGTNSVVSADYAGATFVHGGEGSLTFTGGLPDLGSTLLVNLEGVFRVSGEKERYVKDLQVRGGTLMFDDAGIVHMNAKGDASVPATKWQVGGTGVEASAPARMIVKGNSCLIANVPAGGTQQKGGLRVEETASQGAILEVCAGAAVTNTIHVGENTNTRGAVYQYGGEVYNSSVNNNDAYCGCEHGSYGYYGLYDGKFFFRSLFACNYYADSTGIFEQRGGVFETENKAYIGRGGGWGEYHMTGGTAIMPNGATIGGGLSTAGAQAVMTLAGSGNPEVRAVSGSVTMNGGTGALLAALNLNAGQLKTHKIERAVGKSSTAAGNHAYVNFNGGTVVLNSDDNVSFFGTGDKSVDRITVYPGGMVFDTNGNNCPQDVNTPYCCPTGRGVASITLPAEMENGKYIGPPEVRIVGGGGTGATAHAIFDPATMSVTGIEVTCPGWDYTEPPTVTIATADRTGTVACTATLTGGETQPGGGFTKAGSGVLTLNAQNTYVGPTVLGKGVLRCGANGVIPLASTVMFEGGELDMNGKTMSDGSAAPLKWGVDCLTVLESGAPMEYPYVLTFVPGATLAVLNLDAVPEDCVKLNLLTVRGGFTGEPTIIGIDTDKWHARWVGNTLRVSRNRGLCVVVR